LGWDCGFPGPPQRGIPPGNCVNKPRVARLLIGGPRNPPRGPPPFKIYRVQIISPRKNPQHREFQPRGPVPGRDTGPDTGPGPCPRDRTRAGTRAPDRTRGFGDLGIWGLGFGIWELGLGIWGFGDWDWVSGFGDWVWIWGLGIWDTCEKRTGDKNQEHTRDWDRGRGHPRKRDGNGPGRESAWNDGRGHRHGDRADNRTGGGGKTQIQKGGAAGKRKHPLWGKPRRKGETPLLCTTRGGC